MNDCYKQKISPLTEWGSGDRISGNRRSGGRNEIEGIFLEIESLRRLKNLT
jgi:hypothetical protein